LVEDAEPWHQLLGYGVVALIAIRLLMALFGAGPLGLQRFYPKFQDLKLGTAATHPAISRTLLLGIALCLLGVTTTGVLMDQGKTLQTLSGATAGAPISVELRANDDDDGPMTQLRRASGEDDEDGEEGLLGEVHEMFANLLVCMVALHVSYLILFKWPLARFMLFIRQSRKVAVPKTQG
jgi:3-ketosteroid 9alpha-monooxygenase subunit B